MADEKTEPEQIEEEREIEAVDEELEEELDTDAAPPDEDDEAEAAAAAEAVGDGEVEGGNGETAAAAPTDIDVLKLQLQRERDLTEHFRQAHDKLGGKVGPKIQERDRELERLRAENERLRAGRPAEVDDDEEGEGAPRVPRKLVAEVERLRERDGERSQRDADTALRQVGEDFGKKYGDSGDYKDEIMAAVGKSWDAIQGLRDQGDVEAARTTLRGVLLESYYGAKERKMTESITKKADAQTADLRGRKKLNAPVGTSKARAVPSSAGPKHPERMTEQELAAHFRSQGRKGF